MSSHQSKLLTTKNLMNLFAVSHMTIYGWRKGLTDKDPLPVEEVKDKPKAIGFLPAKIKAWAKKHKVAMTCDEPASLLGQETDKPGPKPKAVAKAKTVVTDKASPATTKVPSSAPKVAAKAVKVKADKVKADPAKRAPRARVATTEAASATA